MRLSILQENFKPALINASKAVPARPQLAILGSIHLKADATHLEVSATDLYVGIRSKVQTEVTEPGSLVIPAKTILDVIQALPPGKLELETQGNTLTIVSSSGKVKLQVQSSEEYPAFPAQAGDTLVFSLEDLEHIDKYLKFAAGSDPTRIVLTAFLLQFTHKELEIVSTDGFRLAHLKLPLSQEVAEQKFLLPAKAISEVCRIAAQEKVTSVTFYLSQELKQLSFMINQTEMYVRLLEGEFPPYEKIMPVGFGVQATWDGDEFAAQIKRAFIFARETSNIIRFQLEADELVLTARSATQGEYEGRLPLKLLVGQPTSIAFNAKYLMDFMSLVKPQTIWFGMNDNLKPSLFRPEGHTHYSYVVMPFRVTE